MSSQNLIFIFFLLIPRFITAQVVIYPIFSPRLPLLEPSPSPSPSRPRLPLFEPSRAIIIVVSIVAVLVLVIGFLTKRKKKQNPKEEFQSHPQIISATERSDGAKTKNDDHGRSSIIASSRNIFIDVDEFSFNVESFQYEYEMIRNATNNFSEENKLGQGGFGAVYKGKLPNDQEIAVKRLAMDSGQGVVEFKNEVVLLARLQHRNLVRLLGFSMKGTEKLLVYEFVKNTSLDRFIFDPTRRSQLDWDRLYNIIGGIARGLLYLHEDSRLRIIHRDLKASNVLLDGEMNPKIADFGIARLFELEDTQANTNRIVGTFGYMAPEYVMHGQFSVKSDVFSFGVLLLEIISGRKNNSFGSGDDVNLISSAWKNWQDGSALNVIDPVLKCALNRDILRCMHIGLLCVQEKAIDRPTMSAVVLMLKSFSITLPIPSEPAFYMHSNYGSEVSLLQKFDFKELDYESSRKGEEGDSEDF